MFDVREDGDRPIAGLDDNADPDYFSARSRGDKIRDRAWNGRRPVAEDTVRRRRPQPPIPNPLVQTSQESDRMGEL